MNIRLASFQSAQRGYTLIELAMVISVVALISAYAIISFGNTRERRDATMIQSAHAALQSIVSQGAARLDVRPESLSQNATHRNAVITALNGNMGASNNAAVTFEPGQYPYRLTINGSGTWAEYVVRDNGDVALSQISPNLTAKGYYVDASGVLKKN